jgi:hypothetical protein
VSPIVLQRARQVNAAIPPAQRGTAAVRELYEVLAIEAPAK